MRRDLWAIRLPVFSTAAKIRRIAYAAIRKNWPRFSQSTFSLIRQFEIDLVLEFRSFWRQIASRLRKLPASRRNGSNRSRASHSLLPLLNSASNSRTSLAISLEATDFTTVVVSKCAKLRYKQTKSLGRNGMFEVTSVEPILRKIPRSDLKEKNLGHPGSRFR